MTLNSIIAHGGDSKLNSITRILADILDIKLSKAQEHHAKALSFNSYNGLLYHLKAGNKVAVNLDEYIDYLNNSVKFRHKKEITEQQKVAIKEMIGSDMSVIYGRIDFGHFIRYSLIESAQTLPLISRAQIFGCIEDSKYIIASRQIVSFLNTGIISPDLLSVIDEVISNLRKSMSLVAEGFYVLNGRYDKKKLLSNFKMDVDANLTGEIHHIYAMPLVFFNDDEKWDLYDSFAEFDECEFKKLVSALAESGRTSWFGSGFSSLRDCFKDAHLYHGGSVDYEGSYFGFPKSITKECPSEILQIREQDIDLNPVIPEYEIGLSPLYIRFGKREYEDEKIVDTIHSALYAFKDSDYKHEWYSDMKIQMMVIKGKPLSETEVHRFSDMFFETLNVTSDKYYMGNFTKAYDNGKFRLYDMLGGLISSVLRRDSRLFSMLFDINNNLIVIDREKVFMPAGWGTARVRYLLDSYIPHDKNRYHDSVLNSHALEIAKCTEFNQEFVSTYSNNISHIDDDRDINLEMDIDIDYCVLSGCEIQYHQFKEGVEIIQNLPFNECRNVYAITCEQDGGDIPTLIVGFNNNGEQVVNISIYLSEVEYHQKPFIKIGSILGEIRKNVSGVVHSLDSEVNHPTFYDEAMIDPTQSEEEFILNNMYPEDRSLRGNDLMESLLSKVNVSAPNFMSKEEVDRELRANLPCFDYSYLNTPHYSLMIIEEDSSQSFNKSASDRKWFSAYSTKKAKSESQKANCFTLNGSGIEIHG